MLPFRLTFLFLSFFNQGLIQDHQKSLRACRSERIPLKMRHEYLLNRWFQVPSSRRFSLHLFVFLSSVLCNAIHQRARFAKECLVLVQAHITHEMHVVCMKSRKTLRLKSILCDVDVF